MKGEFLSKVVAQPEFINNQIKLVLIELYHQNINKESNIVRVF